MAWLVVLVPLLAAPVLFAAGRPRGRDETDPPRALLAGLASVAMAATATLALLAAGGEWEGTARWSAGLALTLDFGAVSAPVSAVLAVLVPLVAGPVMAFASHHEDGPGLGRLLALMAAFVAAMELLVGAADLLALLFGWELVGVCSWALIGHEWRDAENTRGADVAFLATRAGDLGLFVAVAAAFGSVGSVAYGALPALHGTALNLTVGGILLAAVSKSAQVPFSPWLFSAMKGPVSVSALLHSATMVAAGAFVLVRLHPFLDGAPWFGGVALGVGLATALAGGFVALLQPHAKKLLAASTSAHHGLMFVAVGAGYPAVAALHLVAHAFFKAPLFLASGAAESRAGSYRLREMAVGSALPSVALLSGVAAVALAGVPPLGGAWTKEAVMTAAGHHAPWAAVLVAVAGGLSAAYATRFQLQVFGRRGRAETPPDPAVSGTEKVGVAVLALASLFLGLLWFPGAREALTSLLPGHAPSFEAWEVGLSMGLILAGVGVGWAVARHQPNLGERPGERTAAAWLGIPRLARATLVRPARALSEQLAVLDDRGIDEGLEAAVGTARALSRGLATLDDRVVDGGVRLAARTGEGLAAAGDRMVEALFDGLPEGVSDLVGALGHHARRLQTGLAHHYYTLIAIGLCAALAVLLLGG